MSGRKVAIVGASGAVGHELLTVLEDRAFPVAELRLLASSRSAGRVLTFRGEKIAVEELRAEAFNGIDLALFSAGGEVSRRYVREAVARGAIVVDNSSAFRLDEAVPLVVPECNADALSSHDGIIANPNCSTIILVLALAPLERAAGLRRVVVSTYQAASGAGRRAVDELRAGASAHLAGEPHMPEVLPHPLAFNLFPQVDVFGDDGYTREEDKMLFETRKILGLTELELEATCVRVPVERCHSESVGVELRSPLSVDAARELWAGAAGVEVVDEPAAHGYPLPLAQSGRDPIAVGRVRPSRVFDPGLAFWLVGDQLRKGAALNAVQIAELL